MPIDKHWEKLTEPQWRHLAEQYLSELRENEGKEDEEQNHRWSSVVVNLGLWSPPEFLWKFILLAISLAESDDELGAIAAGAVEYLLGRAGEEYIDLVEREAKINPKFAKTLSGVLQYTMTDEVWARVQALQAKTTDRLKQK